MSAKILPFEEPDQLKAIKERLAFLNNVQMELDREMATYLRILKRYEEQR